MCTQVKRIKHVIPCSLCNAVTEFDLLHNFRSILILSWKSTWYQRDPNTSSPTSPETSHLWGNCFWAFWNTTPQTSGIHHGYKEIPCFMFQMNCGVFPLLVSLLPFLFSCCLPSSSVLHHPLWFRITGLETGAGVTFGLTKS